jgi:hypothetical protein
MEDRIAGRLAAAGLGLPRRAVIGLILIVALLGFEIFNFDTTRFALRDLMGDIRFLGFEWAAILALAFCSIDFAGLVRLFTPEKGREEPREVWYLMGAWLLGATMNAVMTWWAISVTLVSHNLGNEVLSRDQLLSIVPIFVAVLVWLTRILFIGAFTLAGEQLFDFGSDRRFRPRAAGTVRPAAFPRQQSEPRSIGRAEVPRLSEEVPGFLSNFQPNTNRSRASARLTGDQLGKPAGQPVRQETSRIRQRPPVPGGIRRTPLNGVQARSRSRN